MYNTKHVIVTAIIASATALGINHWIHKSRSAHAQEQIIHTPVYYTHAQEPAEGGPTDFTYAAEKSIHTVVHIKTSATAQTNNNYFHDPFRYFFEPSTPQQKELRRGSGSGVIVSQKGYILTNNHVIEGADKIEVTLNDKRTYIAELIGTDPSTDLALLKINETNLPFINYGNSDEVRIGEWVLAVGNPFNLTSTVTAGIVSAKARNINILNHNPGKNINPIESFIQTDAAVNPGNSGGALINTRGELIGINTAIASNTGSYTGYSFAIPVNIARKVVADLIEFGTVQRAFIGITIRDLDAKLAEEKNISEIKGVYVEGLTKGGAAETAGIKHGDIILKVAGSNVNNVPELQEQVSRYRPGEQIEIILKRGRDTKNIRVVLKNKDGDTNIVEKSKEEAVASLGATFEPASKTELKKLNIDGGLKVIKLQAGKLLSIGVKEGFILTAIDKNKVHSVEDLKNILQHKTGGVLIEGIYPSGTRAYYGFGI